MNKMLFLDLEETILDDFTLGFDARAMNIEKVRAFLEAERPDSVRLFSFAVQNENDLADFRYYHEKWLSGLLGVQFELAQAFTTEKLFALCRQNHEVFDDERECRLFHGKDYGFQRYIELSPEFCNCEVVLLDDMALGTQELYPQRGLTLRTVNVNQL